MRKPIYLHKNHTSNQEGYQLKLSLNLETIIPENDSVRLLSQFLEAMDLTDLYSTYKRINSLSPGILLKIVLYSYMNGDYSSRSMELNCKRDINFMCFLEGGTAPDHATFMRMKEDAMGNGQLKPGFNLQHGVDAEYITWLSIGPQPTDTTTLIPFLKEAAASRFFNR